MMELGSSMVVRTLIRARKSIRWLVKSSCDIALKGSKEHEATPAAEQDVHGGLPLHCDKNLLIQTTQCVETPEIWSYYLQVVLSTPFASSTAWGGRGGGRVLSIPPDRITRRARSIRSNRS